MQVPHLHHVFCAGAQLFGRVPRVWVETAVIERWEKDEGRAALRRDAHVTVDEVGAASSVGRHVVEIDEHGDHSARRAGEG